MSATLHSEFSCWTTMYMGFCQCRNFQSWNFSSTADEWGYLVSQLPD